MITEQFAHLFCMQCKDGDWSTKDENGLIYWDCSNHKKDCFIFVIEIQQEIKPNVNEIEEMSSV